MSKQIQLAVKTALAGVALSFSVGSAYAGTVDNAKRFFDGGGTSIGVHGDTLIATGQTTSAHSYTDNVGLNYSAWGHAGRWYSFEVTSDVNTNIQVTANSAADWAPAFTVYRTDGAWGGGTQTFIEAGIVGNTPRNFNGTGNIGDNGTLWMQEGAAGNTADSNAIATLAYVNSGATHHAMETNWGEHIHNGVHARDGAGIYSDGVAGSVSQGNAELTLAGLDTGWYTVYVGGANALLGGSPFSVQVSAVPVPAAVYLFGTGLIGLLSLRRKTSIAS